MLSGSPSLPQSEARLVLYTFSTGQEYIAYLKLFFILFSRMMFALQDNSAASHSVYDPEPPEPTGSDSDNTMS